MKQKEIPILVRSTRLVPLAFVATALMASAQAAPLDTKGAPKTDRPALAVIIAIDGEVGGPATIDVTGAGFTR